MTGKLMKKLWYFYTMKFYLEIYKKKKKKKKKNQVPKHKTTWMNRKNIMLKQPGTKERIMNNFIYMKFYGKSGQNQSKVIEIRTEVAFGDGVWEAGSQYWLGHEETSWRDKIFYLNLWLCV